MKLEEALVELRKGKKIRHRSWAQDHYVKTGEYRSFFLTPEVFACDGWEVVRPPPMNFGEAMRAVAEWKRVRRRCLTFEGTLFMLTTAKVQQGSPGDSWDYTPNADDIRATDWEVVEP